MTKSEARAILQRTVKMQKELELLFDREHPPAEARTPALQETRSKIWRCYFGEMSELIGEVHEMAAAELDGPPSGPRRRFTIAERERQCD